MKTINHIIVYVILSLFLIIAVGPFVLTWFTAFKSQTDLITGGPFKLPEHWRWDKFVDVWSKSGFGRYFLNSVIILVPVVIVSLGFSILAGYAFANMSFKGDNVIFYLLLGGIFLPAELFMIPLYELMARLHLINTYWAVILPQIGQSASFGALVLRAAFQGIPKELTEAAVVDGASDRDVLWRILVPIVKPAIKAAGILISIWTWNEFLLPLVLISSRNLMPLPLGLAQFQGRYLVDVPRIMTGVTIITFPMIILYLIFQRDFIRGLTQGAIK
jgi:raffinose/stachyose/melibiose transport system permease protein